MEGDDDFAIVTRHNRPRPPIRTNATSLTPLHTSTDLFTSRARLFSTLFATRQGEAQSESGPKAALASASDTDTEAERETEMEIKRKLLTPVEPESQSGSCMDRQSASAIELVMISSSEDIEPETMGHRRSRRRTRTTRATGKKRPIPSSPRIAIDIPSEDETHPASLDPTQGSTSSVCPLFIHPPLSAIHLGTLQRFIRLDEPFEHSFRTFLDSSESQLMQRPSMLFMFEGVQIHAVITPETLLLDDESVQPSALHVYAFLGVHSNDYTMALHDWDLYVQQLAIRLAISSPDRSSSIPSLPANTANVTDVMTLPLSFESPLLHPSSSSSSSSSFELVVRDSATSSLRLCMAKDQPLSHLVTAYLAQSGLSSNTSVILLLDGEPVSLLATPLSLDLESGDCIDITLVSP